MKKIVSVLMLVFALILGGCSSGVESLDLHQESDTHNSVDQSQLTDLQNQINDLKAQIAAIEPGASDETINAINVTISNLQTSLAALQAEFDALKDQVGTDNAAIFARLALLKTEVDGLKTDVADLADRVTVLEEALAKIPQANAPLFVSAHVGNTKPETEESRGATIRWTASAGGATATSYNVWAVSVDKDGFLGVPFKVANVVGSVYYWNGHLEGLPVFGVVTGPNPEPLSGVRVFCYEEGEYLKYRFAVTAVDANGNESAPSVTAKEFKVKATNEEVY